ncbi:flavodoxin [Prosthecochloris sp. SCSIO W1101]|uniref:flavodoxin n=1 Tax=Prosthecochloris sp. SCSIO W1101 TaxID=2992242 RepID=UPI00223D435A|nr:flavodoxin [Prosthecochloris sp. SCSIO W1101]UZJ42625.1 flavodoxin [Prosthecochloris sp. SCSIO W1101]
MSKTAIFYGSSTGVAESVAEKLAEKLNASILNVADNPTSELTNHDVLIFGTSTTGFGELQDDWASFISEVKDADLTGKTIAIFACGDSASFSDSFVGSMDEIYKEIKDKDCDIIGFTETDGYDFNESPSVHDGKFVGLAIDDMNQSDLTDERIDNWVSLLKTESDKL